MVLKNIIRENCYYDSVTLMLISSSLKEINGVEDAAVMMATETNINILDAAGLILDGNKKASPNSMIIAVKSREDVDEEVVNHIDMKLNEKVKVEGGLRAKTIENAYSRLDGINFAIVSIPGKYAKNEVMNLLKKDTHVMLFSDNVSLEEEVELKTYAVEKGLLMMGPDCGTAIINGIPIGFANKVNNGRIGLVAASGTGLQEVTTIISNYGGGVSQALGTGGRDLKKTVSGMMMMQCLDALENDENTELIVIISKPAPHEVSEKIIDRLKQSGKKSVVCVLGGTDIGVIDNKIHLVTTLETAAFKALELSGIECSPPDESIYEAIANAEIEKLKRNNSSNYIRGLFSGGTLCYEAMLIFDNVNSNISSKKEYLLENVEISVGNTFIDMGEDYFTDGRPHPMIDQTLRLERLEKEANDCSVGVILFDVVLGYGSNMNTASELAQKVKAIKSRLEYLNRYITFIASICGTDHDPQKRFEQKEILESAGIIVLETNAQAAYFAKKVMELSLGGGK